jgi:hypothetical protein
MMFKSDDCAGQGRCRSSPSCSSNHDWTVQAMWIGALPLWKTTSFFRKNIWIMGCTWLPNLSTYSVPVIQPWRVIMGPTEYHDIAAQNSNCSPTVDAGFENITSDSFCANGLQEEHILSSAVSCAAVILWFFETFILNVWQSLSVLKFFKIVSLKKQVQQYFLHLQHTRHQLSQDNFSNCVAILALDFDTPVSWARHFKWFSSCMFKSGPYVI